MDRGAHVNLLPPPGRPSWKGGMDLPLAYLGWGRRDFAADPVSVHRDVGMHMYLLLDGRVEMVAPGGVVLLRAPYACLIDMNCPFGLRRGAAEILVWIWRDLPTDSALRPSEGGWSGFPLHAGVLGTFRDIHQRCRDEVALADAGTPAALTAYRQLLEVELLRAGRPSAPTEEVRWRLATGWIERNLSIHTPVPALCDYLHLSASSLHRLFKRQCGQSPGRYFRDAKRREALRLVREEGVPVKEAAYGLGYRHPSDLTRFLGDQGGKKTNAG